DAAEMLLTDPSSLDGEILSAASSHHTVRRIGNYVIKAAIQNNASYSTASGLGALCANIGLEHGLRRIGDYADLQSGARITSALHLGGYFDDKAKVGRWLMSFEAGVLPTEHDKRITRSRLERGTIYERALQETGIKPEHVDYDDHLHNLLLRDSAVRLELVKLDMQATAAGARNLAGPPRALRRIAHRRK
ncbi:MAG TPA: hypothetical protein VF598_00715, partial [Hymenobacter sp.]